MTILMIDDHPMVRQGMKSILNMNHKTEQILEAGDMKTAQEIMRKEQVDMVLLDLLLGKESGFDMIRWMRREGKQAKCMIVTSSTKREDITQAGELQVDGYLVKDAFVEDILYAIRVIERGGTFFSPTIARGMMTPVSGGSEEVLTAREKEVLELLQQGKTNAQISKKLYISEATTKKHVSNILSKLNVKHRVQAALYAKTI